MNRRNFIRAGAAAGLASSAAGALAAEANKGKAMIISSKNGLPHLDAAMEALRGGADPLDAALAVVGPVEADPKDMSVGYGGLPNEQGVVQCDAAVMHGPTSGAGSVGALEDVMHASLVAKDVMEKTDHVLLVGDGARRFALDQGYEEIDMLTPAAREMWLRWRRDRSKSDDWINPKDRLPKGLNGKKTSQAEDEILFHWGTIHASARDANGDFGCVTTTSGLSYKVPGRVGDSPILGAGLYLDNEVGTAGSTGRGEANLKTCACFLVVEQMRMGKSPGEACREALKRILTHTKEPYLLDAQGQPDFNVSFYAMNKAGEHGGAALRRGLQYAVHDGQKARLVDCEPMF